MIFNNFFSIPTADETIGCESIDKILLTAFQQTPEKSMDFFNSICSERKILPRCINLCVIGCPAGLHPCIPLAAGKDAIKHADIFCLFNSGEVTIGNKAIMAIYAR